MVYNLKLKTHFLFIKFNINDNNDKFIEKYLINTLLLELLFEKNENKIGNALLPKMRSFIREERNYIDLNSLYSILTIYRKKKELVELASIAQDNEIFKSYLKKCIGDEPKMNDIITDEEEKKIEKVFPEEEEKTKIEDTINQKELCKLEEVFSNSFSLQITSEKGGNKGKIVQENENDKSYNEEDFNDKNKQKKNKKYKEIIKFKKELNFTKKLKQFYLFYHHCKNPSDDKSIYKIGKVLAYTYRKNFPKINNYKNKKTFTTDTSWGCMVRCGQMILSRGIYRLLKKSLDTETALRYTVPLFADYPITENNLYTLFKGMIAKYLKECPNKKITEFYAPFSLKTLCDAGELYEKTAGEYFSDVEIINVFKKISEYYNLFIDPRLKVKIMTFQNSIKIKDVVEICFIQKKFDNKAANYILLGENYYYYDKNGIIFIEVRLGLNKIPKEYYTSIKDLFKLKECIGIISSQSSSAYYFIGYSDDSLLYLEPNITKEADKIFNMDNILDKHVNKEIHILKIKKMSTTFTIGFLFRTYEEFLELYQFCQKAKQNELHIFGINKQNINFNEKHFDGNHLHDYEDKDENDLMKLIKLKKYYKF